jgi:hypothetical protein
VHRTAPGQGRRQAHGSDPLSNAHKGDSSQTLRVAPRETPTRVYWNPSGKRTDRSHQCRAPRSPQAFS